MEKKKVLSGFIWRFLERCGAQGVSLVVSIVLARLLDPTIYGTIALITVFTNILQTFIDGGFGTALVQKKDTDNIDFSTVFFFNVFVCIVIYIGMYIVAPYIAHYYKNEELTSLIRVLSIILIISGVKNIQQAYVSRHMLFKRFFFATLGGTIIAGVVGIIMAYRGYGAWALVTQYLVNASIDTIILWLSVKWRPQFVFSKERLKSLFSYGWKLLISKLIDRLVTEARSLIIGKKYSSADLAYYNRGETYPNLIISNIDTAIDSVLLPTMSKEQDNIENVKSMARRSIRLSSYIVIPLMAGFAVCAEPIVSLVLTDKWLPCVFYLRLFCINYSLWPIHTANVNAIKALGRSDVFLKIDIIKRIVGLIAIITTMWFGVKSMAIGLLLASIINQIINAWPNRKLLNYTIKEQIKDIIPVIELTFIMSLVVIVSGLIFSHELPKLIVQILVGIATYILLSYITKNDSFMYIKNIMNSMIGSRRRS